MGAYPVVETTETNPNFGCAIYTATGPLEVVATQSASDSLTLSNPMDTAVNGFAIFAGRDNGTGDRWYDFTSSPLTSDTVLQGGARGDFSWGSAVTDGSSLVPNVIASSGNSANNSMCVTYGPAII